MILSYFVKKKKFEKVNSSLSIILSLAFQNILIEICFFSLKRKLFYFTDFYLKIKIIQAAQQAVTDL